MKYTFLILMFLAVSFVEVTAMPVVDDSSIKDIDRFYVDNGQCLAYAQSGVTGDGGFEKSAVTDAATGSASGMAFGAITGGDIGSGAAVGAIVGGLGGAGSVYASPAPINDHSYESCMLRRGYKFR